MCSDRALDFSRVVVVSPHGDDESLGAGGFLKKLSNAGTNVHVLFMAVDASLHFGYSGKTTLQERLDEIRLASEILGYSYEVVYAGQGRLECLDTLPKRELVDYFEDRFNQLRPDLVLLPEGADYDQDHHAVFKTAHSALRPMPNATGKFLVSRVLTYESPKLTWAGAFKPHLYCDITKELETKLQALSAYHTQLREAPHVRCLENVRALAQLRGSEVGIRYAEGFGVLRWVI